MCTYTITPSQSESVHLVILLAKPVVGAKDLTIVKSFRKLTAAHSVMREGVMALNLDNVVISHALVDVPVRRKVIAWYVKFNLKSLLTFQLL